jgi:5'-3' exonuclease
MVIQFLKSFMEKNMTLAIIDGDVLAYQACKNRWDRHETGVIKLDENGQRILPTFSHEEDVKYFKTVWKTFNYELKKMLDTLYCTDFVMAVKDGKSYRDHLYDDYKATRTPAPSFQNHFVPKIRTLAVYEGLAIPAIDREADDYLRTWALEARRAEKDYIVCSIDKDLLCIPGKHWRMSFDIEKQFIVNVSEREALENYYIQLISGDSADNIPGVPRIGPVKAKNVITACITEEEMQEAVVGFYLNAYGDEWYNYFLINAKLIHIQTHLNDFFDCSSWPIIQELC